MAEEQQEGNLALEEGAAAEASQPSEAVTMTAKLNEVSEDRGQGCSQDAELHEDKDEVTRVEAMVRNFVESSSNNQDADTELEGEMAMAPNEAAEEESRVLSKPNVREGDESPSQNEKKRALDPSPPQDSRKKRGRKPKTSARQLEEDDVCFVCFDGGELQLCDQRSCPKAYHCQCIGREKEYFQKKGNWLCGWHFCCVCKKKASVRCCTCPKAYCAGCRKKSSFLLIEKKRGLCDECVPLVTMIERNESVYADGNPVDFNDPETYECLFKEYWEALKAKQPIKLPEMDKDGKFITSRVEKEEEDESSSSESEVAEVDNDDDGGKTRDRKTRGVNSLIDEVKCSINQEQKVEPDDFEEEIEDEDEDEDEEEEEEEEPPEDNRPIEYDGWASKELKHFLKCMGEDPSKPLNRGTVNKLVWQHIKANNLQNPRKKSIIRCDEQLQALFGRKILHHQSVFKDIPIHFAPKQAKKPLSDEENDDKGKLKKDDALKPEAQQFAAITPANINLVYLRRALLEDLLDDPQFEHKVIGTYVRIRVPGLNAKSETCYRLVQIVGIKTQADEYKSGKKTTNIVLQIMNLNKKEDVTVDLVSNQDFTADECKRLRQSIRCGFIPTPTVADFEQKNLAIREAKLNDWFDSETTRLSALRDRANEKGRKKELRECVEKLQRLSNPSYRAKELAKVPAFEVDPHMDPGYESKEEEEEKKPAPAPKRRAFDDKSSKRPKADDRFSSKRPKKAVEPPAPSFTKQDSFKRDGFDKGWDNEFDYSPKPQFGLQRHPQPEHQAMPLPPPPPLPQGPPPEMLEKEKVWFYLDPTGTCQGPFSLEQLRKWDASGHFPADLRIWRSNQPQEQGILLKEALGWGNGPALPPPPLPPPPPPLVPQQQAYAPQWEPRNEVVRPMVMQEQQQWNQGGGGGYKEQSNTDNGWGAGGGGGGGGTAGGGNTNWGWNNNRKQGQGSPSPWAGGSRGGGGGGGYQQRVCKFYQKGYCRYGDGCQFQHI